MDAEDRLVELLSQEPGQSKYQLSRQMPAPYDLTSEVNKVLYRQPHLFDHDGQTPPRWRYIGVSQKSGVNIAPPQTVREPEGSNSAASEPLFVLPTLAQAFYGGPPLRRWQAAALHRWDTAGRRGIIEAVTGSGKTAIGVAAISVAVASGMKTLVIVPTLDLQQQWSRVLRKQLQGVRIGEHGGGKRQSLSSCDVLVSTVHSAVKTELPDNGHLPDCLLVADEVHRYGATAFASALSSTFIHRLGLTATLERSDDGVESLLRPYFGAFISGCDYKRAYDDRILAPVRVALVGVAFTPEEQQKYSDADEIVKQTRWTLVSKYGLRDEEFGQFIVDVQKFAGGHESQQETRVARRYLKSFNVRREVLAQSEAKAQLLSRWEKPFRSSGRSLIFTDTVAVANRSALLVEALGVAAVAVSSEMSARERQATLANFAAGDVRVLCAPRILDEGVDVPEADLAVILSASRSKRQMVQRMGRVIRPKSDGRNAIFVVAYVRGTSEDPASGAHQDFLRELLEIAETVEVVDAESSSTLLSQWQTVKGTPSSDSVQHHSETLDAHFPLQQLDTLAKENFQIERVLEDRFLAQVLAVFDDRDHIASLSEIIEYLSLQRGESFGTTERKLARLDPAGKLTWIPIRGHVVGAGGTAATTTATRLNLLRAFEGCIEIVAQTSSESMRISELAKLVSDSGLATVPLERASELIEVVLETAVGDSAIEPNVEVLDHESAPAKAPRYMAGKPESDEENTSSHRRTKKKKDKSSKNTISEIIDNLSHRNESESDYFGTYIRYDGERYPLLGLWKSSHDYIDCNSPPAFRSETESITESENHLESIASNMGWSTSALIAVHIDKKWVPLSFISEGEEWSANEDELDRYFRSRYCK
ncbi:hypothetical protein G9444_6212 [Rhodococcus erythropolis]|uniref:DEAD/DEAH box helicase n=1 Tax=Rhodococcus erythropolis TaxID=1833 RepID=A0A6G9D2E2_RHOER|nr:MULTISPECIES: DEAD/DEAH box helicase [Rhodococcus]QIP43455.1 hypothetical protein G9444_6212 [Rhodococcus erythropolis]UKO86461.1 DEAD/DEAH box helicase [Rhodococcus erythropolis]BBE48850.1 hypothetical protein RE2895_57810 [Rhodococcus erythropolis]